jgi:glucosamine-6-phosphate deaminase
MKIENLTPVEQAFLNESPIQEITTKIPYILVDNFPKLGKFVALRFLEWVTQNPEGVISLPTGKTPEYFIKWTEYLLKNWSDKKVKAEREEYGLTSAKAPDFRGLQFVQIDEFYPISPKQHNSFYYYVNKYYIEGFGLDREKALLINSDEIELARGKHFTEVFPDLTIDTSLRFREGRTNLEKIQQESIYHIDNWCAKYEAKIMEKGGIGFFLGGIGPDGHIAFNTRGTDPNSNTRLTPTNFETQAVAAADLGGIEISRHRLVITIGLETITYNPESVAIIFAAGESKANIVKNSLESELTNLYPATVLQKLKNGRFYITLGAAKTLEDVRIKGYKTGEWSHDKTEKAVVNLCKHLNKYGSDITVDDLKASPKCKMIPNLGKQTVQSVMDSMIAKLDKGLETEKNQVYLHTGPHHDDIMLGILPHISHQLREPTNSFHFAVLTSGFTAVTNKFIRSAIKDTRKFLRNGRIEMVKYPDFFDEGYKYKWDKDVYHFLNKVASLDNEGQKRGLSHRLVRAIVDIYKIRNEEELMDKIYEILNKINRSYDGEKNPPEIQKLKGMLREFEEELVWAHFGVQVKNISHLRLGFYTGDIFTEQPTKSRDVKPVLDLLRKVNPTVLSLTLDPEGSGPDTHYKVLQATAEALREWRKEKDLSDFRVWGYRNVWYRFHPSEVNTIVPVSLNSLAVLNESFNNCYLSQVDASFPSYEHDGHFSTLAQKLWVEQLKDMQLLMGKEFFFQNSHPRIRAAHGLIYFRDMNIDEFLVQARELEKSTEG